jgi:peptide/nickel transport system permease protein
VAVSVPVRRPRFGLPTAGSLLVRVARRPAGLVALVLVVGIGLAAAFAPLVAPYGPAEQDIVNRLEGPSASHILGTDHLGRDLFSRVVFGARVALGVSIPAVLAALLLGLLLGLTAGYLGGRVDNALIVVMDSMQSFPAVILALTLLAVLGPSLRNVLLVVAITFSPQYARVARASVLAVKQSPFIEAGQALGAGPTRIVLVHVLPNIMAPLFILLAMNIPAAITVEAGLSFLGVGVQPPTPSWGVILAEGFERVREAPWPVIAPALALVVTTLGFTTLGETLRDVVDPRLRGVRAAQRPRA